MTKVNKVAVQKGKINPGVKTEKMKTYNEKASDQKKMNKELRSAGTLKKKMPKC